MTTNAPIAPVVPNVQGLPQLAKVSRKTLYRTVLVAVLLALGTVGMRVLENSLQLTFDKPPMPLVKPLAQVKRHLGMGSQYVADRPDDAMEEGTLQVLGTKDYLLRQYTDVTKQTGQPGAILALNVNYYSTGSSTPHVPEICWAGSGLQEAKELRRTFTVKGVRRANGTVEDVRMRMISFYTQTDNGFSDSPDQKPTVFKNVAYLFEVNGDCVSTPKEVISSFWKASNKHAYHTKVEVTVQTPCTQDEAEKVVSDFIREALPAVEECLPVKETPTSAAQVAAAGTDNQINK
jgi:hypothetical protein